MHHIYLIGCPSALFDNLAVSWRECRSFEMTRLDSTGAAIERIYARRPDWVVHCGSAGLSSWEANPASWANEVQHISLLAQAVAEVDARLAVVSSDRVLAGPRMFKDENEPPAPDAQAQQLHAIEQAALAHDVDRRRVLIVRTHAFGWSASGASFGERIWRSLAERDPVELDLFYATPILASDLAGLLIRCFRAQLHGVLHIGGAERTTPFRFAQELARTAGFDHRLVRARAPEMVDGEPVIASFETSLGSRLVRRELNISLPLLRESISRFVEQATNGHREQLQAMLPPARAKAA